jgi:hypothetical protein
VWRDRQLVAAVAIISAAGVVGRALFAAATAASEVSSIDSATKGIIHGLAMP